MQQSSLRDEAFTLITSMLELYEAREHLDLVSLLKLCWEQADADAKRAEEEDRKRRKAEEEERKAKQQSEKAEQKLSEAAAKKVEEFKKREAAMAAAAAKAAVEERARQLAEGEKEMRRQRAAEAAAAKKAEEEDRKRRKAEEDEERRRRKAVEEEDRKRRKDEEEEERRKEGKQNEREQPQAESGFDGDLKRDRVPEQGRAGNMSSLRLSRSMSRMSLMPKRTSESHAESGLEFLNELGAAGDTMADASEGEEEGVGAQDNSDEEMHSIENPAALRKAKARAAANTKLAKGKVDAESLLGKRALELHTLAFGEVLEVPVD